MIIMKFGGTSVGSAERYRNVAKLVGSHLDKKPVVVVSAMSGTTDWLLNTARAVAESGRVNATNLSTERVMAEFHTRYQKVVEDTITNPEIRNQTAQAISGYLQQLLRLLTGIEMLGELSPRSLDAVAAFGEKLSSKLAAGALQDAGFRAEAMSTEELIITDSTFNKAVPIMSQTVERSQARLLPLIENGIIPVLTGFIGATPEGITTTLGRGGSDFSASIIGAALDSEEIWIWTDVDGVMSADPRLVPSARTLRRISYAEAGELSHFGAKVIHPMTVLPAVEKNIPIYIKNTFNPEFPGTIIDNNELSTGGLVKAIASTKNLAVITVSGSSVLAVPGIAARVFSRVSDQNLNVYMISHASSGHDLCFVVEKAAAKPLVSALLKEFDRELERKEIESIQSDSDVTIIAAVGAGMRGTPGVAGRLFSTLGLKGINIMAIAQGSSELNISFIVAAADEKAGVEAVHEEFLSFTGLSKSVRHHVADIAAK